MSVVRHLLCTLPCGGCGSTGVCCLALAVLFFFLAVLVPFQEKLARPLFWQLVCGLWVVLAPRKAQGRHGGGVVVRAGRERRRAGRAAAAAR